MPRVGETPYSPGALRAWARYMSRIGRDDLAAQLNAQADAAEQMQPVGSAFDTWLGGYGSRLGLRPQAAAPAAARPQVSGNYLGNLGTWRPNVPYGGVNPYLYGQSAYPSQQGAPPYGGPGAPGVPYGGVNPYLYGQAALPVTNALGPRQYFSGLYGNQPTTTKVYPAPGGGGGWGDGGGRWNPWASFTTGTQAGWYSVPQTGAGLFSANAEAPQWAGSTLEQAQRLGKQLEGKRLIYGSSTYGNSPAPVIGGSRKMSWAGQTKAKKNWNPNKFANRKTSAPNPLPMAATGPAGVGLVYGNANWGRP